MKKLLSLIVILITMLSVIQGQEIIKQTQGDITFYYKLDSVGNKVFVNEDGSDINTRVNSVTNYENVDNPKVFCEIVGIGKFMSNKVTIQIDFGEKMKFFADNRMKDSNTGNPIVFNSMVDALNYMGKKGWNFEQAYVVTIGNQNVYHWLMSKQVLDFDSEVQKEIEK